MNYRSECLFERELVQKQHGITPDEAQVFHEHGSGLIGLIGTVIAGKTASCACSGPRPPPRVSL